MSRSGFSIRRGVAYIAGALSTLWVVPATVAAQAPRWQADLSGARIQYDTLATLNAPSASGLLEWRRPTLFGRISAGVTGFQDSGWTIHGGGDLSRWFSPTGPTGPLYLELGSAGSASRHSSGFDSWIVRADGRAHAQASDFGGWAGIGVAWTRNSLDSATVRGWVPNVGAWVREGPARLTVRYEAPDILGRRFHEATATAGHSSDHLDLTVFGGWRRSASGTAQPDETWLGATAAIWLAPGTAVLLSGGRYAPDVLQGLPGGDYLSIGVRLTGARVRPVPETTERVPLLFSRADAREGAISFEVPDARSVEIAGDWNDWTPTPLERGDDGRWLLPPGIEPGVYRFNLRVDGTRWIVPEGVPSTDDGFGGEVGLLIVAEDSDPQGM